MSDTPQNQQAADSGLRGADCSGYLSTEQIRIGSWWAAADGGKYGCVVLSVNLKTKDATVLGTDGKQRKIDTFKLQYRYGHCIPNHQILTR